MKSWDLGFIESVMRRGGNRLTGYIQERERKKEREEREKIERNWREYNEGKRGSPSTGKGYI